MNYWDIFYNAFLMEMKHHNLDHEELKIRLSELSPNLDVTFDNAYYRCAYTYLYASCSVNFIKYCVEIFKSESSEHYSALIAYWKSVSDAKTCSISCGPGLDYLSFIMAISNDIKEPVFKTNYILSKDGDWRNTVYFIQNSLDENVSKENKIVQKSYSNIVVLEGDLSTSVPNRWVEPIQNSQVFFLVKTLNLIVEDPVIMESILETLKELIALLQSQAVIICIDTIPSMRPIMAALSLFSGRYLCGPYAVETNLPNPCCEQFKNRYGCYPVLNARGMFFVWQKLHFTSSIKAWIPSELVGKENLSPSSPNIPLHTISQVIEVHRNSVTTAHACTQTIEIEKDEANVLPNVINVLEDFTDSVKNLVSSFENVLVKYRHFTTSNSNIDSGPQTSGLSSA